MTALSRLEVPLAERLYTLRLAEQSEKKIRINFYTPCW